MSQEKVSIKDLVKQFKKENGAGSIFFGEKDSIPNVEVIPTGIAALDKALGVGGWPKGRIIEIYGPESSGKTTCSLHSIVEAQKMGIPCYFIDAEHAFDRFYAKNLGVDIDNLLISQPDNGEQALQFAVDWLEYGVKENIPFFIVIDSVAALVPKAEIEGDVGELKMGLQARMMSQAMRKMTAIIAKSNSTVIFINQLREKIGVVYGNPEVTSGGNALKFYASVRLEVRKQLSNKTTILGVDGNNIKAKVIKNKVAPPFQTAEFYVLYGKGAYNTDFYIDRAVDKGYLEKKGSWFSHKGTNVANSRDAMRTFLDDNPEFYEEMLKVTKDEPRK